jgi:hypothetical protein
MLVAQHSIGVEGDFGAEQVGGCALELEHVEEITVVSDVAAKPARGCEGEIGDAVPGSKLDQLSGMRADLLLEGGRQVGWLGKWLAHAASLCQRAARGRSGAAGSPRGWHGRSPRRAWLRPEQ